MKNSGGKIAYARWIAERSGIVELNRDWERAAPPPIWHTPGRQHLARIVRADPFYYAERSGYFVDGERIIFVVLPKTYPQVDWPLSRLYVAGTFNRSGFNSPKLASFLIHKVYIKCLGACPEDLY